MVGPVVEPASGVVGVAPAVRAVPTVTPAVRVVTAAAVACVAPATGAVADPATGAVADPAAGAVAGPAAGAVAGPAAGAVFCVVPTAEAVTAPAVELSSGLFGSIYSTIILSNSASTASLHIVCQVLVELLVLSKFLIISVPFCGRFSRINRYARQVIICCCKAISLRCSTKAS